MSYFYQLVIITICYVILSLSISPTNALSQTNTSSQSHPTNSSSSNTKKSLQDHNSTIQIDQKSKILDIHIDSPFFRPLRVMIPFRNLSTAIIKDQKIRSYLTQSLNKFINKVENSLHISGFFAVQKLSLYAPPLFPWPDIKTDKQISISDPSLLQNWLDTKPNKDNLKALDLVVLTSITLEKNRLKFEVFAVDWTTHKLRFTADYLINNNHNNLDLIAYDFSDKVLESFTNKPGIFKSRIVFIGKKTQTSSKHVYSVRVDGSDLRKHTQKETIHLSPSWNNDGTKIIYTSYQDNDPDLFILDTKSNSIKKIYGYKGIDSGGQRDPLSDQIVFTGSNNNGDTDIYVGSINGGKRRALIAGAGLDVDPTISPDGKFLSFVSGRFGNPHIFLAKIIRSPKGLLYISSDKRLTFAGWYNGNPDFSPNSEKIVFAGYDKEINRFDLFMMNNDGKNLERLTLNSGDNESPSWSPNGQLIVFDSNRAGNNKKGSKQLYIIRRDGSFSTKIKLPLYSAQTPDWGPQS